MFRYTFLSGAFSLLMGHYYISNYNRIDTRQPYFKKILSFIPSSNHIFFMKTLIKLKVLDHNPQLKQYILAQGFDIGGSYIEEVRDLGFGGMIIGPTSWRQTNSDEIEHHLGITYTLALYNSFLEKHKEQLKKDDKNDNFQVFVTLIPNYEVVKYTPYIIKDNLINAIQAIKNNGRKIKIILDFKHRFYQQFDLTNNDKIAEETVAEAQNRLKDTQFEVYCRMRAGAANQVPLPSIKELRMQEYIKMILQEQIPSFRID